MKELKNYAIANGLYNNLETIIHSNQKNIVLIDNLEIIIQANKTIWATGNLTYTIKVKNIYSTSFENIIITDILNPTLISLIVESVRINGVPVGYDNFTYDKDNGILIFRLSSIEPNQTIAINYQVKKNNIEIFKLDNYATLSFNNNSLMKINNYIVTSNIVIVYALSTIYRCKEIQENIKNKNRNQ